MDNVSKLKLEWSRFEFIGSSEQLKETSKINNELKSQLVQDAFIMSKRSFIKKVSLKLLQFDFPTLNN